MLEENIDSGGRRWGGLGETAAETADADHVAG
jgi:hypothetical protein